MQLGGLKIKKKLNIFCWQIQNSKHALSKAESIAISSYSLEQIQKAFIFPKDFNLLRDFKASSMGGTVA